ncbi:transposase [Paenibacillus sp. GCM10023252]|uniref:transposase n=1 Tax=Paenibacillus sp. GCM10023252 TaxID=3252649 RepID=UPI0036205405
MDIHFEQMSLEAFRQFFHNEEVCCNWLFGQKWPNGFSCTKCGHSHAYTISTRRLPLYECASCGYQNSLTAGTVMHNTRTSLFQWIHTMYLVSQQESINAERLAEVIGVTYKTAWLIMHKLRDAMSQVEEAQPLTDQVRIDSDVYGYQMFKPTLDRVPHEHPILIGSSHIEEDEDRITQLKLLQLTAPDVVGNRPTRFGIADYQERYVEHSATMVTIVPRYGRLRRVPILRHYAEDSFRWMNRRFHGIGGKHLQAYLHEYCFRFNTFAHHASSFNALVQACIIHRCPTYKDFVARDYRRRYSNVTGLTAA